jgi:hypothetical protein
MQEIAQNTEDVRCIKINLDGLTTVVINSGMFQHGFNIRYYYSKRNILAWFQRLVS